MTRKMIRKMTKFDARELVKGAGISLNQDYHQLRMVEVEKILAVAKLYGYRKSPTAPGSKGRMFFQFLQRGK